MSLLDLFRKKKNPTSDKKELEIRVEACNLDWTMPNVKEFCYDLDDGNGGCMRLYIPRDLYYDDKTRDSAIKAIKNLISDKFRGDILRGPHLERITLTYRL